MIKELSPVIGIKEDNCVNCHRCIAVCPAKMCNDGSQDHVNLNHNLCLGCGQCIDACTHNARHGLDHMDEFLHSIQRGDKLVAVVAPSAAANFEGTYLNLNGWLKDMGVSACFDVSFGAELTVKSYLEHLKENDPLCIIAQPCPTLVSYIEIYRPDLMAHLAPADSPMMHTVKMIKRFYPQYADHRVVMVSPCFAKKREFEALETDVLNVSIKSLADYLEDQNISLSSYEAEEYDNPPAERAVLFSTPGGLMRTAERELPGIENLTRKIEGQPQVYDYLAHLGNAINQGKAPIHKLIDCLNCEHGCNGGPGTINRHRHIDIIEGLVEKRNKEVQKNYASKGLSHSPKAARKRLEKFVNKYWEPGLYHRSYVDRSAHFKQSIRNPSQVEIDQINSMTHKESERDILNCGACGYKSCEQMAVAIFNGLNRPENCRKYMSVEVANMHALHKEELNSSIQTVSNTSITELETIMKSIETLNGETEEMASSVAQSSASVEEMVASIQAISSILEKNDETVDSLKDISDQGQQSVNEVSKMIGQISSESEAMMDASSVIQKIASQTNLLAMNAAIEAAHAGEYGRGFAVVSDEVRNLAETAGLKAKDISQVLNSIKKAVDMVSRSSQESREKYSAIVELTNRVNEQGKSIRFAISEQSAGGQQVLEALKTMQTNTQHVRESSRAMVALNKSIMEKMTELLNMKKMEIQS